MKTPKNPFILSGYYGKKWFCDRETEKEEILNHLSNERNVVLYAWRRMGKTALIKNIFEELKENRKAETVYIDLLSTQTLPEAIRAITKAVYETFGKTSSGFSAAMRQLLSVIGVSIRFDPLTGVPDITLGINQPIVPEKSLEAIGDFLRGRKKQIIISLDEFQQVSDYAEKNAEAAFRHWMQEFPEIRFIYSGSHRGMMEAMFTKKNRPFYKSAQLMAMGPIAPDAYSDFIQSHFSENGKRIKKEQIKEIYHWCRGQTYSIQLVCNYLFGRYENVENEHLSSVFKYILEQENAVFINFQKLLTINQWELLRAIGKAGEVTNPTSQHFVIGNNLGAASSVSRALQALVTKELVIQENEKYMIHDIILSRWLAHL